MRLPATCHIQLQLCQNQQNGDSPAKDQRYQMLVAVRAKGIPVVRVFDRLRDCVLLEWRGAVVRHLLESGVLPSEHLRNGYYACDKSFIWHLILAGAATKMTLD